MTDKQTYNDLVTTLVPHQDLSKFWVGPLPETTTTDPKVESTLLSSTLSVETFKDSQGAALPEAIKYDQDKRDWTLVPMDGLEEIVKVLEFGARKYDGWNFAKGSGMSYTRILKSLLRHVFAFLRGEDLDPESGLSHMAHAGCNVLFLLHYIKNPTRYSKDDRYKY